MLISDLITKLPSLLKLYIHVLYYCESDHCNYILQSVCCRANLCGIWTYRRHQDWYAFGNLFLVRASYLLIKKRQLNECIYLLMICQLCMNKKNLVGADVYVYLKPILGSLCFTRQCQQE